MQSGVNAAWNHTQLDKTSHQGDRCTNSKTSIAPLWKWKERVVAFRAHAGKGLLHHVHRNALLLAAFFKTKWRVIAGHDSERRRVGRP